LFGAGDVGILKTEAAIVGHSKGIRDDLSQGEALLAKRTIRIASDLLIIFHFQ
jgi:hypothetical protein